MTDAQKVALKAVLTATKEQAEFLVRDIEARLRAGEKNPDVWGTLSDGSEMFEQLRRMRRGFAD